jgi:DNA-binding MarR family transcriptional regulator
MRNVTATPDLAEALQTTETPDIADIAASLRLSATRLARQLRQQSDIGLTPTQLSALTAIHRDGPLTLGALAEQERVAPPTITKVIGKLEEQGLVIKQIDAGDRRVCRVATSPTGEALLAESRQRKDAWLTTRLTTLDADQRRRLAGALGALDQLAARDRP